MQNIFLIFFYVVRLVPASTGICVDVIADNLLTRDWALFCSLDACTWPIDADCFIFGISDPALYSEFNVWASNICDDPISNRNTCTQAKSRLDQYVVDFYMTTNSTQMLEPFCGRQYVGTSPPNPLTVVSVADANNMLRCRSTCWYMDVHHTLNTGGTYEFLATASIFIVVSGCFFYALKV